LRAPAKKRVRRSAPATLSARLGGDVRLEPRADGKITASVEGYALGFGTLSPAAATRAAELNAGLPLSSFGPGGGKVGRELEQLVRRLTRHGLLEYRLGRGRSGHDLVVIEPQTPDYWPRQPPLGDADAVVLSRFAYMRRRGQDTVLESPRSAALFKICDPKIASVIASLSTPQRVRALRRQDGFPGVELLALLLDCRILFKVDAAHDQGLRPTEGDGNLVLWDFHDLLFHTRSTAGRHANPLGGLYRYAGALAPPPAIRPAWPGKKIDLRRFSEEPSPGASPVATLLRERHSTRSFDEARPITLAELSRFLAGAARVVSTSSSEIDLGDGNTVVTYAARPYPSAGAAYELELYLGVDTCEGLARGFYHYDAGEHALTEIDAGPQELHALLTGAADAMGVPAAPQVLITVAARFGRLSWKYSSIAYALVLRDVGVLLQSFYLMAAGVGLGGCAIGIANIELFAKMTGIEFHVEGPVGQFAIGRGTAANQ